MAIFCILYTLANSWKQRYGAVPEQPWCTAADKRHVPLSLAALLSHELRQNAAEMAALVEGKRLGMHACSGPASWDHRPLVTVLIGHVVMRLASSHGIDAGRRGVLERGHPLGAAVDAGLDTTTRALGVERPAEGGVLHAQPPLSGATGSAHAGATRWPAWTSILPATACHQGSDGVPYSRSKERDG